MYLLDILKYVSVVQFLIFAVFLFILKKGNIRANRFLAVFLVSKAFCYISDISYSFLESIALFFPPLLFIGTTFELILGPSLLFYSKTLMYNDFKLQKKHIFHLVPFVLILSILTVKYLLIDPDIIVELFLQNRFLSSLEYVIFESVIYTHFIVYSIWTVIELTGFRKKIKESFSTIDKIKMDWLGFILYGFIFIWGSALVNLWMYMFEISFRIPWVILIFGIFVFANAIILKGLSQPELFSGIIEKEEKVKYSKVMLSENLKGEYLVKLKNIMETDKLYLDPAITINHVAEKASIPSHHISQVLNTHLNKNFFEFVNEYRIEECKKQLLIESDKTVLEILFSNGFNSKASFNRAFKKHTGMTPSEFKKSYSKAV